MSNLEYRQKKIQDKRKQTPWRDFVRDVCSWYQVNLYKNNGVISRFPETPRCGTVYPAASYIKSFGDGFPGIAIDSQTPFLQQLQTFFATSPKMALMDYGRNENAAFADTVYGAKNVYMSISVGDNSQDVLYSNMIFGNCTKVINSMLVTSFSENVYYSQVVNGGYNIFYSKYIYNSKDIRFSDNLIGCTHCMFCSELENQSYCIHNVSYPQEEYLQKKHELLQDKSAYFWYLQALSNKALPRLAVESSWNAISFSERVQNAYFVSRVKEGRNIFCGDGTPISERLYDVVDIAKVDDAYGRMGVGQDSSHMYCGSNASTCHNVFYSYFMDTCSYCLGCIGLKNKSYHIFNKEYSKEEWQRLVDEIFTRMEQEGTLGTFFPWWMCPFYFNDTASYLIDKSFTKEEVTQLGYLWRETNNNVDIPPNAEVIDVKDLGNYQGYDNEGHRKIDPQIVKKVIRDSKGEYYRIIPMELEFLQKYALPLPELHRLERIRLGFVCN